MDLVSSLVCQNKMFIFNFVTVSFSFCKFTVLLKKFSTRMLEELWDQDVQYLCHIIYSFHK